MNVQSGRTPARAKGSLALPEPQHGEFGAKSGTIACERAAEAVRTIVVDLPLPPMQLHPNVSGSWRAKAPWTKATRALAMGCAYNVRPAEPFARCVAVATFRFTQMRYRDGDNLMAWLKATIDGLTDAAIWTDDSVVTWLPPIVVIEPGKAGGVTITVWEVTDD